MNKTTISIIKKVINKKEANRFPLLSGVAMTGDYLIATDLDHAVIVAHKSDNQGVVSNFEMLLDNSSLFNQLKIGELEDFPTPPSVKGGTYKPLTDLDKILEADKTISSDDTRPALCHVRILDGQLMATDGYSMYYSRTSNDNMWIDKTILAILKAGKKLNWEYKVTDDTLCLKSGEIEVFTKQPDYAFPSCSQLLRKQPFTNLIGIDTKTLQATLKKLNTTHFAICGDKVYAFPNYQQAYGQQINTNSAIEVNCVFPTNKTEFGETRRVFMPTTQKVKLNNVWGKVFSSAVFNRIATPKATVGVDETQMNYAEVL